MKTHSLFKHFVVAGLAVTTALSVTTARADWRDDQQAQYEAMRQEQRVTNGIVIGAVTCGIASAFIGKGLGHALAVIGLPLFCAKVGGDIARGSSERENRRIESCHSKIISELSRKGTDELADAQKAVAASGRKKYWQDPIVASNVTATIKLDSDQTFYHDLYEDHICRRVISEIKSKECEELTVKFICGNPRASSDQWEDEIDLEYIRRTPVERRTRTTDHNRTTVYQETIQQQVTMVRKVVLFPGCTQAVPACVQYDQMVPCTEVPGGCNMIPGQHYNITVQAQPCYQNQPCAQAQQGYVINTGSASASASATAIASNGSATAVASASAAASAGQVVQQVGTPGVSVQVLPAPVVQNPVQVQGNLQPVPSPVMTYMLVPRATMDWLVNVLMTRKDDCVRLENILYYAKWIVFTEKIRLSVSQASQLLKTFTSDNMKLEALRLMRFAIVVNGVDGYCVDESNVDVILSAFNDANARAQATQLLNTPAARMEDPNKYVCKCTPY